MIFRCKVFTRRFGLSLPVLALCQPTWKKFRKSGKPSSTSSKSSCARCSLMRVVPEISTIARPRSSMKKRTSRSLGAGEHVAWRTVIARYPNAGNETHGNIFLAVASTPIIDGPIVPISLRPFNKVFALHKPVGRRVSIPANIIQNLAAVELTHCSAVACLQPRDHPNAKKSCRSVDSRGTNSRSS